jgi:acyl-CoA thioester hydrolase
MENRGEAMKYLYRFKVRFGDTDAYGIVHHRNYYNYFEEARFQFSNEILGFDVESKVKFPVIESACIYKNPLKFDLKYYGIELDCRLIHNSKIEFTYIIKDDKKKYAQGKTVHVFVGQNNKMCLEIPKWLSSKILDAMDQNNGVIKEEGDNSDNR